MTFQELSEFIEKHMRMSHIYQPIMLVTLLKNNGECSESEIAKAILANDQSQIEYYEKITRDMVGRVLRSHDIVAKEGRNYKLRGHDNLTEEQIQTLINLCNKKLEEYIDKRGSAIWEHRKKSAGYISGTIKYEVLKMAKFHCELCGISADIKALEVDHIIPRNKGGDDNPSNFQALCYSCNAMKRDRDDTGFRKVIESYSKRDSSCIFCNIPKERIILENNLAYAIYDAYPVTGHHALIIPKRHTASYFELGRPEINACNFLLEEAKKLIDKNDEDVAGYNIGINNGETAGQTISHCHIHLIPRRKGDIDNPRGGVRGVIPNKMKY